MQVEIRADKKSMTVGGYVNVVGRDSRVLHDKTGPYVEQIMPGAFKKALAADSKVELRFNHKKILDSEDLELREDNIGLRAQASFRSGPTPCSESRRSKHKRRRRLSGNGRC